MQSVKKFTVFPTVLFRLSIWMKNGDTQKEKIVRAKRKGKMVFDDAMPPFFVEFEAKRLDNNIGYIRFNAFMPPVDHKFKSTIESMQDTSALIIDIRGNHGGFFDVRKAIAEALVKDRVLFWRYKGRDKTRDIFLEPTNNVYNRLVAVIVDYMCVSSCEEFSGGLQAIKRATIIGDRTPGVSYHQHIFLSYQMERLSCILMRSLLQRTEQFLKGME